MTFGSQKMISRRALLLSQRGAVLVHDVKDLFDTITGVLPWKPNSGSPAAPIRIGPWHFFRSDEGTIMEALADWIIPPDPETPGGKNSGSAVFVDRQLAGPYSAQEGLYLRPPFIKGSRNQGEQSEGGPRKQYRDSLSAHDKACGAKYAAKGFADLDDETKDDVLREVEGGAVSLDGVDGKAFFRNRYSGRSDGVLRRPNLRWESRHGGLENDRLSRRAFTITSTG